MEYIAPYFQLDLHPTAHPDAVVVVDKARFTVLADRLIRMEYSPEDKFEDRPSQAFWYREQPVPEYTVERRGSQIRIDTGKLVLHYEVGAEFNAQTLWIELKEYDVTWHSGDPDPGNLGGTARTLDGIDGSVPLSTGLVSRSGWSLVDDSLSLVFNQDFWLEPRKSAPGQVDLYFLGYGSDYLACLRDFNRISGSVPMIPRWVLGNWWSRYWAYTQEELTSLIESFQEKEIPLSVCIVDMDWHITDTGNDSSGWTGYSWNRQLFPNPEGLLKFMHEKGLQVALNLHPASGIHRHEEMYEQMCAVMDVDSASGEPVEFDITDPKFVDAYFRILHHPMEAQGVDFWWMDWQQGKRSKIDGLDPLWWLNHLHFYDLGRDGTRRSFIFSRWGGLGNHRYPIGFSGDSVISWASLAFQPYFTATASNVNYGWWSHDVGGHMGGIEDAELNARWVQFGVFLPVLRIHATKNPYHDRRPWAYDAETFLVLRDALQLRHALIPYLYSMAWRYHNENIPPILPMYYEYPHQEEAYHCPNQYLFGSELIVAPFITPKDLDTRLSRAVTWLPEGDWFDFFNGQHYTGSSWHAVYGTLSEIPVFARAGAIVPQAPKVAWGGTEAPTHLILNVFPGADGKFDLYDDEGNTNFYLEEAYAITPLAQEWHENQTRLVVGPAQGDLSMVPGQRRFDLLFRGFTQPEQIEVLVNGEPVNFTSTYLGDSYSLSLEGFYLAPTDCLSVTLTARAGDSLANREDSRLVTCLKLLEHFKMESWAKASLSTVLPDVIQDPAKLGRYLPSLSDSQMRALFEVISGAGLDYTESTGTPLMMVWNNREEERVTHQSALARLHDWWLYPERYPWSSGPLPRFRAVDIKKDYDEGNPWVMEVNYYGVLTVKVGGE